MQERDLRIDLIKLIATAMVVILHTVENAGGGYIQQCLYLLGTFGIPLFLMVNGYLMYDREITPLYFKKKFVRYFRFVLLWSILIGLLESLVDRRFAFLDVFIGAWIGKGMLYHLWFITTLLLILGIHCLFSFLSKGKEWKKSFLNTKWMITLVILMSLWFAANIFFSLRFSVEIRDVVPAPFRLLTNGGFYLLGMYLHSQKISVKKSYLLFALAAGYIGICLISISLSVKWASSFYASIFCVAGTLAIMLLCMQRKVIDRFIWRVVDFAAPTSIGIWLLHPLVLTVLRKLIEYAGMDLTLPLRVLMVPVVFVGCMIVSKVALKVKGVQILFRI